MSTESRSKAGWVRFPVTLFVIIRILTLFIAFISVRGAEVHNPYATDPIYVANLAALRSGGFVRDVIEPWDRWDTGWYMKIAMFGYDANDGSIIFAPLFPALSAAVGGLVGDTLLGGLLVSSIACLVFLIIFYRLAMLEAGERAARVALFLLVAFPTAFYLMAAYTEALFMALTAGALLAGRERRWWLAAVLAFGAGLTRLQGWVLFFPLGWLAFVQAPRFWELPETTWMQRIRQAVPGSIPRLVAMGTAPLAVLGYFIYLRVANLGSIGDAYEKPWGMVVRPPWSALLDTIAKLFANTAQPTEVANLAALLFIVLLLVLSIRRLPIWAHLYLWPTLLLILLRYYPRYLLNGTLRYVLDFFPIFITLGAILVRRRLLWQILGVIALLIQFILLFLFTQWAWIS